MLCLDLEGVTATTTLKQHTMNISTRAKTGRPTGSVQQIAWKHVNQWTISAYSRVEIPPSIHLLPQASGANARALFQ